MKVYIAGKITGLDNSEIFKKFYDSKKQLEKHGYTVMSPAVLALNQGFDHSDYMHICYAMIDVCDIVFLQKDWQQSKGARMEFQYAKKTKKKIFFEDSGTRED